MTDEIKTGLSRRTLAKGAAWTVPAAAVVAAAPAYAVSINEPGIDFGKACGNTGSIKKGCGGDKTLQVPLTLSNNTGADIVFQITSMYTCNCATAPTGPGTGIASGVRGIWATPAHTVLNHNVCSAVSASTCAGGVTNGSVVVPNGATNKAYWIESNSLGSSSSFSTTINWRLLDASCNVLDTGTAQTASAIAPQNCGSDKLISGDTAGTLDSVEEPIAKQSVAEEPVIEEPAAEEPVIEEPAAEEPVIKEPAVEEPAAEEVPGDATPEGEDA